MCKVRKYEYYDIKVTNIENSSIEKISILNDEKVDKANYKQMLEVYRGIKEDYKNQNVIIDFYGVSNDSTMNILYEKRFDIISNSNELNADDNMISLCEQLNYVCDKINNKQKQISNQKAIYDKRQDILLHQLENLQRKNLYELNEQEKENMLKIAIDIQDIRNQRREVKNESSVFDSLRSRGLITKINNLNNQIHKICFSKIEQLNDTMKKCKQGNEKKLNKYEEIPYKDFKDRIRIMKEMQNKFDAVRYDESKKVVFCYDKLNK